MKSLKKSFIHIIYFLGIPCIVYGTFICSLVGCRNQPPKQTLSVETLREISDLAVLDCYYHIVSTVEMPKDGFFSKAQIQWIEYTAKVKLGVDISQLKMDVVEKNVTIELPTVKVLSVEGPENMKSISNSKKGQTRIPEEKRMSAINKGKDDIKQKASSDKKLLNNAEQRVKLLLSTYINQVGEIEGKKYNITWKNASEDSDLDNASNNKIEKVTLEN